MKQIYETVREEYAYLNKSEDRTQFSIQHYFFFQLKMFKRTFIQDLRYVCASLFFFLSIPF